MAEGQAKEYHLVVFAIGDEEFGVEITQVKEIVRLMEITYLPKAPAFIEGVINLRGQVIAVVNLAKRLGISAKPKSDAVRIIILEVQENNVGMVVDSVSEVLKLGADQVQEVPQIIETEVPQHYIYAVGKLKDRLLVLLDLNRVLTPEEIQGVREHLKTTSNQE